MITSKHIYPPALQQGDTIGIIAPAGNISDSRRFDTGVRILKEMGFEVKFPRDLWAGEGYLSAKDNERAREFNSLWSDPEVHGIMSLRGGFGCLRMLQGIDLKAVKATPKPFVGFSDITVLHSYLLQNLNLTTFHGPVLTSLMDCTRDALERFYNCLLGKWDRQLPLSNIEILRGGKTAHGPLTGGNLSSIMTLLGTPFDQSWERKIVFLEDINEPLYKIDRMFTQLYHAGKFNGVNAILLGDFTNSAISDPIDQLRHYEWIWTRILELTNSRKTVVWGNFPSGHFSNNMTLPYGAKTTIDSSKCSLTFTP